MKDTDKMPFGKYKGIAMAKVPANYLLWLNEDLKNKNNPFILPLKEYIQDNIEVLKQEVESSKPFWNDK